jgi:hypothetical protein
MEDLPHPCFTGNAAGDYAKKHDPFVYYRELVRKPANCKRVVPLDQLAADERAHALPEFIWITPNLCHDMHDCSVSTADRFLKQLLPPFAAAAGTRRLCEAGRPLLAAADNRGPVRGQQAARRSLCVHAVACAATRYGPLTSPDVTYALNPK